MSEYLLGLATLPAIVLALAAIAWVASRWMKRNLGIGSCLACESAGLPSLAYEVHELNYWQTYWVALRHALRRKRLAHREGWMDAAWPRVLRRVEAGHMSLDRADTLCRRYGVNTHRRRHETR